MLGAAMWNRRTHGAAAMSMRNQLVSGVGLGSLARAAPFAANPFAQAVAAQRRGVAVAAAQANPKRKRGGGAGAKGRGPSGGGAAGRKGGGKRAKGDDDDVSGARARKRTEEEVKAVHREVERRRTKRIGNLVAQLKTEVIMDIPDAKSDKASILEGAVQLIQRLKDQIAQLESSGRSRGED